MERPGFRRYIFVGLAIMAGATELLALLRARWRDITSASLVLKG